MIKKTLGMVLAVVVTSPLVPAYSQTKTPGEVLEQFCKGDSTGGQLTTKGWRELAVLFTRPARIQGDRLFVTRDVVVVSGTITDTHAKGYCEYVLLGQLDSSARFTHPVDFPPGPVLTREPYDLILTPDRWELGPDGGLLREIKGPLEWRIDGAQHVPQNIPIITVDTAIQYITDLKKNTSDDTIRRNADATLNALGRLRR